MISRVSKIGPAVLFSRPDGRPSPGSRSRRLCSAGAVGDRGVAAAALAALAGLVCVARRRDAEPRIGALARILSAVAGDTETLSLWLEYRRTGDQALRDRLILTYAPLVKYVAGRLGSGLPAHIDDGDLVSYGLLGLISAIERYEPDRDIKFETYAIARIRGAIIDELRALDWVPRSVRSRARADRAGDRRARGEARPRPERRGDRRQASGITVEELEE